MSLCLGEKREKTKFLPMGRQKEPESFCENEKIMEKRV